MLHDRSILPWFCFLTVILLTSGRVLHADGPTQPTSPNSDNQPKTVKLQNGATLKVQDAPDPGKNLHIPQSQNYDPRNFSMNQTSSFANKSFSADSLALSKKTYQTPDNFSTKTYGNTGATGSTSQLEKSSYNTSSYNGSHGDTQFGKSYTTTASTMDHDKSTQFASTSADQNHTSSFSGKSSDVYSSNMSKQYIGPGAQHVPDGMVKENKVIDHVSDLPNRPLSIDEVRGLINHGFKPDTTVAPGESSKALNDPNYKPEASPDVPETTVPAHPVDDGKNVDLLPSPGTMSETPPENSAPLPQH